MGNGQTFIEINYNSAWISESIAKLSGFMWLYEWGIYIFLLVTIAILFWIFFDSITKHKDQQALVPRIFAMLGFFMIIPTFIFRFTGNADGVTVLVRLAAEPGAPYYPGPINWNVNWLVAGYGPIIAIVALLGVVVSVIGLVIYMSTVHRVSLPTSFTNPSVPTPAPVPAPPAPYSREGGTVVDVPTPRAATVIDNLGYITVTTANGGATKYSLPNDEIVIGRDSSTRWPLNDVKVSGRHIMLSYSNGTWYVEDLGSTNGTYLNEQRISGKRPLNNGDKIRIGDTTIEFGSR